MSYSSQRVTSDELTQNSKLKTQNFCEAPHMRPFTSTITIQEALRRVRDAVVPVEETAVVELPDAAGRVAAEDIVARADVPPFDRAAMDGYAVRAQDTAGASPDAPRELALAGVTYAGHAPHAGIAAGECVEIATGAPLPPGADAVVMVERTAREGERVLVREAAHPAQHVGRRANDLASGAVVVSRGDWLSPARVGAIAAAGVERVTVFARPLVALASTGDELVPPGQPLGPGQIHDVNRFTLPAVIAAHGCEVRHLPPIADTAGAVRAALDAVAGAHLVLFTGGSSVGDRDLVAEVVAERGDVIFHGVAMKPGKPTLLARLRATAGPARLFLGLSGNPTSCLANAYILLVPMLRAMARLPEWRPQRVQVPLGRDITALADRHQFYPVRLECGEAVAAFKGSGEITSLSRADGYVEIPAGTGTLPAGSMVTVTLFH